MQLTTSGRAVGISGPVVGIVTRSHVLEEQSKYALITEELRTGSAYACQLTAAPLQFATGPSLTDVKNLDHLRDGDIVCIEPSTGTLRTLYRPDSEHNTLFITERCNSNCLMCSQPPKDHDDSDHFYAVNKRLIRLISRSPKVLGITGGEPTLLSEQLLDLITDLRDLLPDTYVHMLSNGRAFSRAEFAKKLAAIRHPGLVVAVPLYADVASVHDYIVQAHHAFDQTVLGLHQLGQHGISVEIRVVLHKLSIPRLPQLAEFIVRNLPFAAHIALMGLEPIGYTRRHWDKLWIDPVDYQSELRQAVRLLSLHGLTTSIYNHQLCTLPESLWQFAQKSISDWKNIYLPACSECGAQQSCGGFFASADLRHSRAIRPVQARVSGGRDAGSCLARSTAR